MKRCEDCVHYDVCQALEDNGQVPKVHPNECYFFKHSKTIVNLPCKIDDTVWVVNKTMGHIHSAKFRLDDLDQIGKRIFMTQAEAERFLKGGKRR